MYTNDYMKYSLVFKASINNKNNNNQLQQQRFSLREAIKSPKTSRLLKIPQSA